MALKDWQTYCSGRGVGLSDFAAEASWRPPSSLLEVDPPLHDRTREVVRRVITRKALLDLRAAWRAIADDLGEQCVPQRVAESRRFWRAHL